MSCPHTMYRTVRYSCGHCHRGPVCIISRLTDTVPSISERAGNQRGWVTGSLADVVYTAHCGLAALPRSCFYPACPDWTSWPDDEARDLMWVPTKIHYME